MLLRKVKFNLIFLFAYFTILLGQANQIAVNRVELMPNLPTPYHIRDWQQVAQKYDSLVFNLSLSGQYLPLVEINATGINYPTLGNFVMPSYVGSPEPWGGEAINQLAAVVGATLVGIDKRNQFGYNWLAWCQDFFNRRPQENVYLNNFNAQSGYDWWYDTMPNIFYFQLVNLYAETDFIYFEEQFYSVVDRWYEALQQMGAGVAPWQIPDFNHRGWQLSTMTPNDDGVKEPEAAGALGWLMYQAYLRSGEKKYLIGAEWCMEFLDQWSSNPSYELQLPYGVYTAARMNAELHTAYNIKKMVNWCFDPQGNVRGWGVTVGNWGGYDCSGLVGEVIGDDYAFAMNTFEMIGALAPMVRYDERFARAIGKWTLNAVNSARFFYHPFLADENQDAEAWAKIYDPQGVIAYEAVREVDWYSNRSPYATGDALRHGWAQTNLALYGASHVGIVGAIVDTTNVRGILKLNISKTDYGPGFTRADFPRFYLLYNPYAVDTTVTLNVGNDPVDVYDCIRNQNMAEMVSGEVNISIPADEAVLITFIEQGAERIFKDGVLYVKGNAIDFQTAAPVENLTPRIKALAPEHKVVSTGGQSKIYCTAVDPDGDSLQYLWQAEAGSLTGGGPVVSWQAPDEGGSVTIRCKVMDGGLLVDSAETRVTVIDNQPPVIRQMGVQPKVVLPGETVSFYCQAEDADGDSLAYAWWITAGDTLSRQANWQWQVPDTAGYIMMHVLVQDVKQGFVRDSVGLSVGKLVIRYNFENGLANDLSPFANNGIVSGADTVVTPRGKGLFFDGINAAVCVPLHPSLNFEEEISVAFLMRVDSFYTREAYPVSHGNWENRWKISITDTKLRWTIKTSERIYDLDSKDALELNRFYFVTCLYNSSAQEMSIYLDGSLNNTRAAQGNLLPTEYDLSMGQHLPGHPQYAFRGVIDEFFLFNHALSDEEIATLYDTLTAIKEREKTALPGKFVLRPNYPDPFNPSTRIEYFLPATGRVRLEFFDVRGRLIRKIDLGQGSPGWHVFTWRAENLSSGVYFYRVGWRDLQKVGKCLKIK